MVKKRKILPPVPEFEMLTEEEYRVLDPLGIISLVNENAKRAVRYVRQCGGPRYADMLTMFIMYGKASTALNKVVRARMKAALGVELTKLKVAYAYWWNRTQYLETFRKPILGGLAKRRQIDKGKETIFGLIHSDLSDSDVLKAHKGFLDLVDRLSGKSELEEEDIKRVLNGEDVTTNYMEGENANG